MYTKTIIFFVAALSLVLANQDVHPCSSVMEDDEALVFDERATATALAQTLRLKEEVLLDDEVKLLAMLVVLGSFYDKVRFSGMAHREEPVDPHRVGELIVADATTLIASIREHRSAQTPLAHLVLYALHVIKIMEMLVVEPVCIDSVPPLSQLVGDELLAQRIRLTKVSLEGASNSSTFLDYGERAVVHYVNNAPFDKAKGNFRNAAVASCRVLRLLMRVAEKMFRRVYDAAICITDCAALPSERQKIVVAKSFGFGEPENFAKFLEWIELADARLKKDASTFRRKTAHKPMPVASGLREMGEKDCSIMFLDYLKSEVQDPLRSRL